MARLDAYEHRWGMPGVHLAAIKTVLAESQKLFRPGDPWIATLANAVEMRETPPTAAAKGH